jgi:hypothetical protein
MKKFTMAFAAVVLVCASARALEDNKANREQEADRYLAVMPVREVVADMAEQMGKNLPVDKRQRFRGLFTKYVDVAAMEKVMKAALVKHLTADELKALADFYSTPVGKSAMKKMTGPYTADTLPTVRSEVMKAQAKAASEMENEPKPAE